MTPTYIDGRRYIGDGLRWRVASAKPDGSTAVYSVDLAGAVPTCSCPGGRYRGTCRHVRAVAAILAIDSGTATGKAEKPPECLERDPGAFTVV